MLNLHFNSTAKRLLGSAPKPGNHLKAIIENLPLHENEFHINETTYGDVRKAIQSIRADCSTGYDNIPAKYLKMCIDDITSPICHIVNSSIKHNMTASFTKSVWLQERTLYNDNVHQDTRRHPPSNGQRRDHALSHGRLF